MDRTRIALKAEKVLDESLWGKQSRDVLAGRYHDGSEMARILSDADTKSLPDLPLDRPAKADVHEINYKETVSKTLLGRTP